MTQLDKLLSIEETEKIHDTWRYQSSTEAREICVLAKQLIDSMRDLEALKIENEENCRIIGMSGECELVLRSENERLLIALEEIEICVWADNMSRDKKLNAIDKLAEQAIASCKKEQGNE